MLLRIVFERADLQRVRVAPGPDPMWETVLSLHCARERPATARLADWRERTRRRFREADAPRRWLSTMFSLVPRRGPFPDFLTPGDRITDVAAGCEALACTPRAALRADVAAVFADRRAPGWAGDLAAGRLGQVQAVTEATRRAHDLLVAPHWPEVGGVVGADRARRADTLVTAGVGQMLAELPGVVGWDGAELLMRYPVERTVHLSGRGLTLVPAYFCTDRPVTLMDPERVPVLVYPAAGGLPAERAVSPELVKLLGRTRAECLGAVGVPRSTSELAHLLGTSVSAASKQATVLREAGLLRSERQGAAVVHSLTQLGAGLLDGHYFH
ncbi:ArsR/SmtB family transcription factor [Amycolatopsis albispora]|uniref:HTH arsR-type domain-containing protein n=1 Tax=Amycolatopsis albispora TaxID=1804986 RepID=A0A344L356_9PSEU|nr:helix-turn-helix domain-containing protein [Amycolatopsis albispora]AXB42480.1 hypothetical protein A4R43_08035 [Amycolatopsis albispora]